MCSAGSDENYIEPGSHYYPTTANLINRSKLASMILCCLLYNDAARGLPVKTVEGITDGWGKNTPNQMSWRTGGMCEKGGDDSAAGFYKPDH